MRKLGFLFSCYNEERAVENSIKCLREFYPDNPIYLVSDGGLDFMYLESLFKNMKVSLEDDTMSATFSVTRENYLKEVHQETNRIAAWAVLDRLERAIEYCQSEYILMMDPDALIRGTLTIPEGVKLLGSRVNKGFPKGFKDLLSRIEGAKVIDCWGATPGIFHVETFKKSLEMLRETPEVLDMFIKEFHAIYAHDVLLPLMFALVGEEETFNPEIIECNRDPRWRNTNHPLVHQYKEFY